MIFNENSLKAKLYRWFYGKYTLPINLCPFFWKLVVAWILVIPFSIFCLPTIVDDIFSNDFTLGEEKPSNRITNSFTFWVILLLAICMVSGVAYLFTDLGNFRNLGKAGLVVWFACIFLGIVWFLINSYEKYDNSKKKYDQWGYLIHQEKTDNILIGFIKAKYNKWCPTITWVKK